MLLSDKHLLVQTNGEMSSLLTWSFDLFLFIVSPSQPYSSIPFSSPPSSILTPSPLTLHPLTYHPFTFTHSLTTSHPLTPHLSPPHPLTPSPPHPLTPHTTTHPLLSLQGLNGWYELTNEQKGGMSSHYIGSTNSTPYSSRPGSGIFAVSVHNTRYGAAEGPTVKTHSAHFWFNRN